MVHLDKKIDFCCICGSNKLHKFQAHASDSDQSNFVNIIECTECTFAWQYPIERTKEESIRYFEDAYLGKGKNNTQYFDNRRKSDISKLELDFVSTLPLINRSLLDIGAGAGIFAQIAAENGFNVTAVDPSIDLDQFVNNPNVLAIKGYTDQIPAGKLFDVVTLWDVIEHAEEPISLINNARKFLKKDGWLVIETGNYKSANRIIGGVNHWIYQLDHRWYFSPDSMQVILKEAGFSQFILSDRELRPDWHGHSAYLGPSRAQTLNSIFKNPLNVSLHVSKYLSLLRS